MTVYLVMNVANMAAHEAIEVHATEGDAERRVSQLNAAEGRDPDFEQWEYDGRVVSTRSALMFKVQPDSIELV